ncbi:3-deoxy-D-arabino-heptulosonate 7-phosphate synthase [Ruficoccus amylovorans]|uniref:3-deoxy-D-arabino-heptulosonate 7-phosphate synthase n=1 Tax=Ruficoccus amylovorans TaxID=1804625 RepID=A0A842HCJ9_9BACT|nr:3-deoxy-D-arabino-heptulosonate 7-phosphate synthase [Ruficoccus amylovorans]MBC2593919.1 3-deoxy-D-arabino-heptulosonate 7-phosphate synthase [Ruficoccus amylovorans]
MIIPRNPRLTPAQLEEVEKIVGEFGCRIQTIVGAERCIYAILGDERHETMMNRLLGLDYVARVDAIDSPYKLMDIKSSLAEGKRQLAGVEIGKEPLFIAGPCTIDPKNPNLFYETAQAVKEAGGHILRGGVWKPRTMPYSYQGDNAALDILLEARARTGLAINTEVMDTDHLRLVLEAGIDVIQIGARNALNYPLLRQIGAQTAGSKTAVLLKRGRPMAPVDEFLAAAEYIVSAGNPKVLLCPRGTLPSMDGYRNHPDESITQLLKAKSWAPVIVDPSHSVGRAAYVPGAALAAMAYGADGFVVETHIDPKSGIGDDPKQSISPAVLATLITDARVIWKLRQKY